jgi:hypothetical protein
MVGCDTQPSCLFGKWYHIRCLNIRKSSIKADKPWFCPECKKNK